MGKLLKAYSEFDNNLTMPNIEHVQAILHTTVYSDFMFLQCTHTQIYTDFCEYSQFCKNASNNSSYYFKLLHPHVEFL